MLGALDGREREVFRRLLVKAACGTGDHSGDACEVISDALGE